MKKLIDPNQLHREDPAQPFHEALNLLEIIKILNKHNGLTIAELSDKLSKTQSANHLINQIELLHNAGLVRSKGSITNRRWILIKK